MWILETRSRKKTTIYSRFVRRWCSHLSTYYSSTVVYILGHGCAKWLVRLEFHVYTYPSWVTADKIQFITESLESQRYKYNTHGWGDAASISSQRWLGLLLTKRESDPNTPPSQRPKRKTKSRTERALRTYTYRGFLDENYRKASFFFFCHICS